MVADVHGGFVAHSGWESDVAHGGGALVVAKEYGGLHESQHLVGQDKTKACRV